MAQKLDALTYSDLKLANGLETKAVFVDVGAYMNGNVALTLLDAETGEPILTATVNDGGKLPPYVAHIKDYSENEGVYDWMQRAGIIVRNPDLDMHNGYVPFMGATIVDQEIRDYLDMLRTVMEQNGLL